MLTKRFAGQAPWTSMSAARKRLVSRILISYLQFLQDDAQSLIPGACQYLFWKPRYAIRASIRCNFSPRELQDLYRARCSLGCIKSPQIRQATLLKCSRLYKCLGRKTRAYGKGTPPLLALCSTDARVTSWRHEAGARTFRLTVTRITHCPTMSFLDILRQRQARRRRRCPVQRIFRIMSSYKIWVKTPDAQEHFSVVPRTFKNR